jgi:hypothetical protein
MQENCQETVVMSENSNTQPRKGILKKSGDDGT